MAEHTPGPWEVHDNPTSNYGIEVVAATAIKAKRVVCRNGGPDRLANARLIAAAPELLDALTEILAHVEDEGVERVGAQCTLCHSYRAMAHAAIAKATGLTKG